MPKDKMKDFNVSVTPDEVMYTNISTSKDGYNSARMVIKKGDKEYMSISYEWEGDSIPGFAMDLMGFMKRNSVETSGIWKDQEKAYQEFSAKGKPKEELCTQCGKRKEECKCGTKKEKSEDTEDD